jgi:hypothetical protein
MKSSERIKQDGGDNANPHCFKGYRNGNGGDALGAKKRRHRKQKDVPTHRTSNHDGAAESLADTDEHFSGTQELGPENAAGAQDQPDFGAPNEKIAALRKVLSEMSAADSEAPVTEANEVRDPEPAPPGVNRSERHYEAGTSLFRGTDHFTDFDATGERENVPIAYTIADLRRSHLQRAKRHQRAMQRRSKTGSFLTGLVLASAVTGTMVGLYVLHPQIINAQPQLAPALYEYVETVDKYRTAGEQRSAEWRGWLTERIGNLSKAQQ